MNELIKQIAEKHKLVYQIPGGELTTCHPNLEEFAKEIIENCISGIGANPFDHPSVSIKDWFGL
jgi:hypothetical protein